MGRKIRKTFTDVNGVRHSVFGETEKECYEKIAIKKKCIEEGQIQLESSMRLKDFVDQIFRTYEKTVSDQTAYNNRSKIDSHILEHLGHMPLKKVKPLLLQDILNDMADHDYSDYMIGKVRQLMNWIFEKAVDNDLLRKNPAERLALPKGKPAETHRPITDTERKYILQVADTDQRFLYFLFMLFCGCRPSEAAEIKGMDIQEKNGSCFLHIRGTKTKNADRVVPVPDYLYQRIPKVDPFSYVVTNRTGKKIDNSSRQHLWNRFKRDLNLAMGCRTYRNELIPPLPLAPDLTPYCLHHTYCTDLAKKGIDIRIAQKLMGHSNISLTANIYILITMSPCRLPPLKS